MEKSKINELKKKTAKKYSDLNLAKNEYVVIDVKRSFIGKFLIYLAVVCIALFIAGVAFFFSTEMPLSGGVSFVILAVGSVMIILTVLFGLASIHNYNEDWLIVTNLRLIQNTQHTLLSSQNQEIDLDGIEDISYKKEGLAQTIFDYGTVRLSTVGDETTYTFPYVANPHKQVSIIRNVITEYHGKREIKGKR